MSSTPNVAKVSVDLSPLFLLAVIAMLVMKFGFHIAIPMLWVLSPLWVPLAIAAVIMAAILIVGGLAWLVIKLFVQ